MKYEYGKSARLLREMFDRCTNEDYEGQAFDHFVEEMSTRRGWKHSEAAARAHCRRMLNPVRGRKGPGGVDIDDLPWMLALLCEEYGAPDLVTPSIKEAWDNAQKLKELRDLAESGPEPRITFNGEYDASKGFVYFIQVGEEGAVKVGASHDERSMKSRVASLQSANPETLNLIALIPAACALVEGEAPADCFALERAFHERFRQDRIRGEWFSPSEDILTIARESLSVRRVEVTE